MKVAYCVLCHRNTNVLRALVDILSADNDIYMHVDKKADINDFREYIGRAIFIDKREAAAWGSPAAIKAIIKLIEETCSKQYDYIALLSGEDLPLQSNARIKQLLNENYGYEYVGVSKGVNVDDRLKYVYPRTLYYKEKPLWVRVRHKLKIYRKTPDFHSLPSLYKGCLWFTITSRLRDYILEYIENNQWYVDAFSSSLNGDEVFFHTIVCNSEFAKNIYMYEADIHDTRMCLRYIDWFTSKERPKILNENDYENMKSSGCLFARKISERINIEQFKQYFELE